MASFISLTDLVYPTGSIYMSTDSTSPGSRFGGTWTSISGALRAGSNIGSNFGSDTCTLSVSQIPSHAHSVGFDKDVSYSSGSTRFSPHTAGSSGAGYNFTSSYTGGGHLTPSCSTATAPTHGEGLPSSPWGGEA